MLREGNIEYLRAGKSLLSGRERQSRGQVDKTDCFMGVQENFKLNMKNNHFAN